MKLVAVKSGVLHPVSFTRRRYSSQIRVDQKVLRRNLCPVHGGVPTESDLLGYSSTTQKIKYQIQTNLKLILILKVCLRVLVHLECISMSIRIIVKTDIFKRATFAPFLKGNFNDCTALVKLWFCAANKII